MYVLCCCLTTALSIFQEEKQSITIVFLFMLNNYSEGLYPNLSYTVSFYV